MQQLTNRLISRARRDAFRGLKETRRNFIADGAERVTVFVAGCNRSGTSMMLQTFEKDWDSRVFYESSVLTRWNSGLGWPSFDRVQEEFYKRDARFVVSKPLVEMHKLPNLLAYFPDSKVVWMYRDVKDVVASNLARWGEGNGYDTIRPIVQGLDDWKSAGLGEDVRQEITDLFDKGITDQDAAALFWYARNSLYFELGLNDSDRVRLVKYEDFVLDPGYYLPGIYDFLNRPYPGNHMIESISNKSIGKGHGIPLSEPVEGLCTGMRQKLDDKYVAEQSN